MSKDMAAAQRNKPSGRTSPNPQTTAKAARMARGFTARALAAKAQRK